MNCKVDIFHYVFVSGFCKADEKNDVYLHIDAYRVNDGEGQRPTKIGAAQFVITPCTDPTAYAKACEKDAVFRKEGVSIWHFCFVGRLSIITVLVI